MKDPACFGKRSDPSTIMSVAVSFCDSVGAILLLLLRKGKKEEL
jgi:hypothetical protein